jgi:hypothetical protein
MKKEIKVEITEIFTAQAGWDRCFYGTIKRKKDEKNNSVVYGKIKVNDGFIIAKAADQWQLGDMLDTIVKMVLDNNLNKPLAKTTKIAETDFCLN